MPTSSTQACDFARAIPMGESPEVTVCESVALLRAGIQILEDATTLNGLTIQQAQAMISSAQRKLCVVRIGFLNCVTGSAKVFRERNAREVCRG